jgi:hypothetical protein
VARPHVQAVGEAQTAQEQGPDLRGLLEGGVEEVGVRVVVAIVDNEMHKRYTIEDIYDYRYKYIHIQRRMSTHTGTPSTCAMTWPSVMRPEGMGR